MVNIVPLIGVFTAIIIFSLLFGEWDNILPKRKK